MGRYTKALREEVLEKIRGGRSTTEVAQEHGINRKTVSYWVGKSAERTGERATDVSRLKRENEALKSIIGRLIYEQEVGEKNNSHQ